MKKKFLIKIISIILTMNLINGSVSFAKEMPKKLEEQEQKLSPQQKKEKEIKTIEETLKKMNSLEIKMQQKVKQVFKDFKKKDYEVKNYNLEVFKKGDTYLLLYTHKKTGAKVYFNLILEKAINRNDELIFRAPSKDDKGLVHFLEHCIGKPFSNYLIKKYQITPTDINANTSYNSIDFKTKLNIFGLNEKLEKEYVELLSQELNNPSAFKKGDSKKGREMALADNAASRLNLDWDEVELANAAAEYDLDLDVWKPETPEVEITQVDISDQLQHYHQVIVVCNSEDEMKELCEQLKQEGLKCSTLTL